MIEPIDEWNQHFNAATDHLTNAVEAGRNGNQVAATAALKLAYEELQILGTIGDPNDRDRSIDFEALNARYNGLIAHIDSQSTTETQDD